MLKLHLSYIELAIFRAQICLDIIDHGGAIFTLSLSLLYEANDQQFSLVYVLIDLRNWPKMVATLHFYGRWEKRPKKLLARKSYCMFLGLYSYRPQKWSKMVTKLSTSMVDKRIDLENCCREKVNVRKKPTTAFLSLYSYRPQKWPQYGHNFSFLWSITEQWWIQEEGPGGPDAPTPPSDPPLVWD